MANQIKGFCPNCMHPLYFEEGQSAVFCNCCDCTVTPKTTLSATSAAAATATVAAPVISFDSAESALIYLENFFETYDWSDYCRRSGYTLEEIEELVTTNKSKNGANAFVWELDFKSVSVPVAKKLVALAEYEKDIADKYDPADTTELFEVFDVYRKVINGLAIDKDAIFARLATDIKYAERFKLEADALAAMKNEFETLKASFEASVKVVDKIKDVEAYVTAKNKFDEAKKAQLAAEEGINAEDVYKNAVNAYNPESVNNNQALAYFEQIRGYSDANEYIKKINKYFNYHSELFNFSGKSFIFRQVKPATLPALNLNKPAQDPAASTSDIANTLSLFEVVNGKVLENAVIKGIDQIIKCYGTRLYYFKKLANANPILNLKKGFGKKAPAADPAAPVEEIAGLYCYDFATLSEQCIDQAPRSQYLVNGDYKIYLNDAENRLFFKKKLAVKLADKPGCMDTLLKKAPKVPVEANNYCLMGIDMTNNSAKIVIDAMVDIADFYGDSLFFIKAEEPTQKFVREGEKAPEVITHLMVCDVNTGDIAPVLSEKCEIHAVVDKKVVYSLWAPNAYNIDLRVYDLNTGVDTLIEKNVLDFKATNKNAIFYTVGNDDYSSLMRNTYDGNDRVEVMQYATDIVGVFGNWIYIKKGHGYNAALFKLKTDGSKQICLCSQFKKFIKVAEDNVYYLDAWDNLHIVRPDGKEDRLIARDIDIVDGKLDASLVITDSKIFYVRRELVDNRLMSKSLYSMDMTGHNVKKMVFDIDKMLNYDETKLYYSQLVDMRYKVTVPAAKEAEVKTYYETHQLHKFYTYNKATGTSELVLTLGEPSGKTSFQKGCSKKNVTEDIVYVEDPEVKTYTRNYVEAAGANTSEAIANGATAPTNPLGNILGNKSGCGAAAPATKGASANNTNNAGCATLMQPKK